MQIDFEAGAEMARWLKPIATDPVRTAVRFPIQMTITVRAEGATFEAVTENISASGLLFSCAAALPDGAPVEFTIMMPASVMGATQDLSVHCRGRVVRTYAHGDRMSVAASIDEYILKA